MVVVWIKLSNLKYLAVLPGWLVSCLVLACAALFGCAKQDEFKVTSAATGQPRDQNLRQSHPVCFINAQNQMSEIKVISAWGPNCPAVGRTIFRCGSAVSDKRETCNPNFAELYYITEEKAR
jgi:hypothetical protein